MTRSLTLPYSVSPVDTRASFNSQLAREQRQRDSVQWFDGIGYHRGYKLLLFESNTTVATLFPHASKEQRLVPLSLQFIWVGSIRVRSWLLLILLLNLPGLVVKLLILINIFMKSGAFYSQLPRLRLCSSPILSVELPCGTLLLISLWMKGGLKKNSQRLQQCYKVQQPIFTLQWYLQSQNTCLCPIAWDILTSKRFNGTKSLNKGSPRTIIISFSPQTGSSLFNYYGFQVKSCMPCRYFIA